MIIASIVSVQNVWQLLKYSNVCLTADIIRMATCGTNTASHETRPGSCTVSCCVPALVYFGTPWFVLPVHHAVLRIPDFRLAYTFNLISRYVIWCYSASLRLRRLSRVPNTDGIFNHKACYPCKRGSSCLWLPSTLPLTTSLVGLILVSQ